MNKKRNVTTFGDLAIDKIGISSTITYTISSYFIYCDFESLNSKGQDLTNTDLVRNLILMHKEGKDQEIIYKNYWKKIENNVGINNVDKFIK